jgi:hypothetical protein
VTLENVRFLAEARGRGYGKTFDQAVYRDKLIAEGKHLHDTQVGLTGAKVVCYNGGDDCHVHLRQEKK